LLTQYRIEDIRNNYAGLLHLALQIIKSENEPDKELLKKLEWIKENTTKRLMTNYFIIVHTIARKMSYSLMTPIEVKVSERKTREFTLGELISEVEEAHIAINDIVKEVAKNYSIDIPYGKTSGGIKIPELPKELQ
jgi:hypothetical protein